MSSDPDFAPARSAQEARLVATVRAMFDVDGLRDPSVDGIARAVGINKATVYRHVASKDELLLLVLESYQREMHDLYAEVDESADPWSSSSSSASGISASAGPIPPTSVASTA